MKIRVFLLLSVILLSMGAIFACTAETYSNANYTQVKKLFQTNETVYLKGTGISADSACLNQSAAKVDYYAPGAVSPTYTHICTSSTCYFKNEDSGVVKDALPLNLSDPSGEWTAKVYRGKYSSCNHSCYWDYRAKTEFNVTKFDHVCSIRISHPENGTIYLIFEPITVNGEVNCEGQLNPLDYYAKVDWENGISPELALFGPVGDPWGFTTEPDYNRYYSDSGTHYIRAFLYKKYPCGDVNGDGKLDSNDTEFLIDYLFRGGPAPVPLLAGDVNGDGIVNVGDVVYLINYFNRGGPRPECNDAVNLSETGYIVATSPWVRILINAPPIPNLGPNRSVELGETVYFDGSASYDPDGTIVSYHWDFGDGAGADGVAVSHAYSSLGNFEVSLTVTDNLGATDTNSIIVKVGSPVAEYITISPKNINMTPGSTREYTATAHDSHGNSWDVSSGTVFSSDGGTFEGNIFTAGSILGTYDVLANYEGLKANTTVTIMQGDAERIKIAPKNASVAVMGTLEYSATAFDNHGNSWDITTDTTFASDAGTFDGNTLTAGTAAGLFDVNGIYGTLSDSATVNILHGYPVSLRISPENAILSPLGQQLFNAIASDQYGNEWDVTSETNFSTEGGTFNGGVLTAGTLSGSYTVVANYGSLTGTADVTIIPGELVRMEIFPGNITIAVGSSHPYTATAYDAYDNSVDITSGTTFSSTGGTFSGSLFTAGMLLGNYIVYGVYGEGEGTLDASTPVHITNAMAVSISISPKSASIVAGGTQAYAVTAYDIYGNSWDVTFYKNCGDVNGDGKLDKDDIEFLISYLFRGGPAPVPLWIGDINEDGTVDVGDVVYLVNYLNRGGPKPACKGTAFISEAGSFEGNVLGSDGTVGTFQVVAEYGNLSDYASITVTEKQNEQPSGPGGQGSSSLGFYSGGGGAGGNQTQPPVSTCQKIGAVCTNTSECCEGACISNVCKIPEKPSERIVIEIIAPKEADVGSQVQILLKYVDTGEPATGITIRVVTPSYEIISLVTDYKGITSYVPNEEGTYDYLVPDYEATGVLSTHVNGGMDGAGKVLIIRNGEIARTSTAGTGFFLFNLAPELLGLILLVAMLVLYGAYLYYKEREEPEILVDVEPLVPMNKIHTKKPKTPEPPQQPEQPEAPENPT